MGIQIGHELREEGRSSKQRVACDHIILQSGGRQVLILQKGVVT